MTPERWQQVDQLYHSALEREPGQRSAFLVEACAGDEELRCEVESLLAHSSLGGSPTESLAGRQGLEPRYADPESAVLPLDDLPTLIHSSIGFAYKH